MSTVKYMDEKQYDARNCSGVSGCWLRASSQPSAQKAWPAASISASVAVSGSSKNSAVKKKPVIS